MCRMVGVLSVRPTSPYKYLVEDECSLLAQARVGGQGDGWGIGYYEGGRARVYRSPRAAYEEEGLFRYLSATVKSGIVIAHVRRASNPRGLPRSALISEVNSQPFAHGRYLFAHNGTVYVPDELRRALGRYERLVKGLNDSEAYFAYLVKEWEARGDIAEAIRAVEEGMWEALRRSGIKREHPYSSLNAIFSDGRGLYALTLYLEGRGKRSLCYGDSEYFRLAYRCDGETLVVASERTDRSEWRAMGNGELLVAELRGGSVRYRVIRLALGA